MPTKRQELATAQSTARMEATRLHFRLGTSFDGPIDVLQIARDLGLVLMMQPLDNLLGFYVRQPHAAGIVINSKLPESLQRFTLAHEIGHHVLGHDGTADSEHAVDRFDTESLVEAQAQAFAGALLMPVPLVNKAIRELPATQFAREVVETDAYLFSRQLGVSYSAGVWALYRRNLITANDARRFIRRGPKAAKSDLLGRGPVTDARADVWVLNQDNDDLTVLCRVGDVIHIQLHEDTSTGYVWHLLSPPAGDLGAASPGLVAWDAVDQMSEAPARSVSNAPPREEEILRVTSNEHVTRASRDPDAYNGFGAGGATHAQVREVTLVATNSGGSRVELELSRPWLVDKPPTSTFHLGVFARPRQLGEPGLLAPDRRDWVDAQAGTA